MRKLFLAIGVLAILPTVALAAGNNTLTFSSLAPRQGDTVIISIPASSPPRSATFNGQSVPVFPYNNGYRALIPIAAAKPAGPYNFSLVLASGEIISKKITVLSKKFPVIDLPIPEKLQQTPQQLTQNLANQNTSINTTVQQQTQQLFFSEPFGLPLTDNRRIVSTFGEIRQAGAEQIRHLGTDFGARTGAAIGAINAGIVSAAYLDPIYGNTIIVNHGQGIYSLYMHLDSIAVIKNQRVAKGTFLGRVGQTGYASAPHLHLSIKISGVSIDPIQFIRTFK